MEKIFKNFNLNINKEQIEKFDIYYELLVFYNNKFNLTAITEKEDVYIKHFVDSILGVDKLCGQTLIDVGSGGGFPAIPLKIMNNSLILTMLEATGKKCEFLKTVVKELNLENVFVINGRAEDKAKDINFREKFDCCSARAVARLNTLCEYCMPFVKVGGRFIAYKGDALDEINQANSAIKILGGKLLESYCYELNGAKRTLISIEKTSITNQKYPRGNGKERKNPL